MLAGAVKAIPAVPTKARVEAMFTIAPVPAGSMAEISWRMHRNMLFASMAITRSKSFSDVSASGTDG